MTTRPPSDPNVHELPDRDGGDGGLTNRQRKVLEVIRNSVDRRGYPPSIREIGDAVGLTSPSSVAHQLAALERKGYLRRDPHRPRAIEVVSPDNPGAPGYRGPTLKDLFPAADFVFWPHRVEELRMFTNINTNKDELLQLVLVGQPELREMIRRPDLTQFAQRVSAAFHL